MGRPRPFHAPARGGHLRPGRRRAPARHRHPRHRHPRRQVRAINLDYLDPARSIPTPGRPTPARWSSRRPARCSTACAENVHASPRDVHSARPPHARCFRHERAFLPHPSAGPLRAGRPGESADRSGAAHRARASPHGRHRPHPRVLRRPHGLRRGLRSPRCPRLGHHRGHPVRLPPAAITTTSASTPGSRPALLRSPTASPACTTWACTSRPAPGLAHDRKRLLDGGVRIRAALDHGTHEAVYLLDPDGNTLELAWHRPFRRGCPTATRPHRRSTPSWTSTTCSPTRADAVLSERLPDRRPAGGGRASVRRASARRASPTRWTC